MDEPMEEIKSISRVLSVRKLALVKPRMGHRELMYHLNLSHTKKPQKDNFNTEKITDLSKTTDSGTVLSSNDFVADLKKRNAYDRAMIIGD